VQVIPMISYEDVGTAAEWLISAFGFQERVTSRHTDDGGTVTHAEVDLDGRDGTPVMLGCPGSDYHAPRRHAAECEHARKWLEPPYVVDGVLVYVNDVEAHQKRARAAGAEVLMEVTSAPYGRFYTVADSEGHRWMFMTPNKRGDVS